MERAATSAEADMKVQTHLWDKVSVKVRMCSGEHGPVCLCSLDILVCATEVEGW